MRKQNLKSQHSLYVEAELWNFKSQNILFGEADLQVTEYSRCGIPLVPYAMVRKTDMGAQGRMPLGQSHLGGAIIYWRWHILGFFSVLLRYNQAVTSQFSELMSPPPLYFLVI